MSNTNMVLGSWRRGEWPEYVTVSHEGMREPGRRYVPERTCRNVYKETRHEMYQCDNGFECSECGDVVEDFEHYKVTGTFNFCPNCGARVVEP